MDKGPAFDRIAIDYDEEFTLSPIGILQRQQVHTLVEKVLEGRDSLSILELNAGTGEDAVWLAQKGHRVTATDISPKMIALAREKSEKAGIAIDFEVLDIKDLLQWREGTKYDLILSNFGGLNCLNAPDIKDLAPILSEKLAVDGILILVIMPTFCIWETVYFLAKLNPGKAFRRRSRRGTEANLKHDHKVKTWYHHPRRLASLLSPFFQQIGLYPVGIAIPPSYLNPFFQNRTGLLRRLQRLEQRLVRYSFLGKWADHYCILFKKKD